MTDRPAHPKLDHHLAKLVPYPAVSRTALPSHVFVYDFNAPAAVADFGDLYIVLELLMAPKLGQQISDLIAQTIGQHYYNHGADEPAEQRFEQAVRVLNRELKALTAQEVPQLFADLSGVIAVVRDNELFAARAGSANALLWRRQAAHRVFDEVAHDQPAKTAFASLAHGHLHADDKLLFGTPAVFFQLDATQLKSALSADSPPAVIKQLHHLLAEEPHAYRSGAVVLQLNDYDATVHSGLPAEPATIVSGRKPTAAARAQQTFTPLGEKLANRSKATLRRLHHWWQQRFWPRCKRAAQSAWQNLWIKYINRNPRLYAGLALGILVVILFSIFFVLRPHNDFTAAVADYKSANLSYLTAQSQLSDGNKTAAEQSVNQAKQTLSHINVAAYKKVNAAIKKDKTITEKLTIEQLQAKLSNLNDKITGTIRVDATVLYSLSAKHDSFVTVTAVGSKLYGLEKTSHAIVQVDPVSHQSLELPTDIPADQVLAAAADPNNQLIYYLTRAPDVFVLNLATRRTSEVKLSSGEWPKADDIATYNGNLYLVSAADQQLTKQNPTSIGFGPPQPYIKKTTLNLTKIRSLAINGNIFVADADGGISSFNLGVQQPFVVSDLPSSLGYATHMLISAKNDSLAALNNHGDRIFTITLTDNGGSFRHQYALNHIDSISSFAADATLTHFYAISGSQLLSFVAQ